jgi:hypothetical protein
MTRRGRRIAYVIVAAVAVAASGLACLVLLGMPRQQVAVEAVRLTSPDSRWVLTVREESGVLATNSGHTRIVLARPDGSDARTVYLGELAEAKWRGPDSAVFVEVESGKRHIIAVPGGAYDYRFDEPLNLAAFVVYAALPGAIVVLVGMLIIRRKARVTLRLTDGEADPVG